MSLPLGARDVPGGALPDHGGAEGGLGESLDRNGAHTHVQGLGLDENYRVIPDSLDIIGHHKPRRALGLFLRMVSEGMIAGRTLLLAGPPGTGKTALAMGLAKSLPGENTPFVHITGSDLQSMEKNVTEALHQALRKAMGVVITEETQVIEGEVVEVEYDRAAQGGKGTKKGKVTVRTTDMETMYDLGPKLTIAFQRKQIEAGDVVRIEVLSGALTKLGRSFTRDKEFDARDTNVKFIECPEGEVQKTKTIEYKCSLHEVDVVNSRAQGYLSLFCGSIGEISSEIRAAVDQKIKERHEQDRATIVPGVLFVDECHMLNLECFAFLNRALENEFAPIVVLATNRGITDVRGSGGGVIGAHGMPIDFLERTVIVPTQDYSKQEIHQILRARAESEGIIDIMEDGALGLLTEAALKASLRYALNILSVSEKCRQLRSGDTLTMDDIERSTRLFADSKTCEEVLKVSGQQFLFHDDGDASMTDG